MVAGASNSRPVGAPTAVTLSVGRRDARSERQLVPPEIGAEGQARLGRGAARLISEYDVVIGAVQALEAIKVLSGVGRPLCNRLVQSDGGALALREIAARRSPACPACGLEAGVVGVGGGDG